MKQNEEQNEESGRWGREDSYERFSENASGSAGVEKLHLPLAIQAQKNNRKSFQPLNKSTVISPLPLLPTLLLCWLLLYPSNNIWSHSLTVFSSTTICSLQTLCCSQNWLLQLFVKPLEKEKQQSPLPGNSQFSAACGCEEVQFGCHCYSGSVEFTQQHWSWRAAVSLFTLLW